MEIIHLDGKLCYEPALSSYLSRVGTLGSYNQHWKNERQVPENLVGVLNLLRRA